MCVSCGCGDFDNDHGDDRPITSSMLTDAAQAASEAEKREFTIQEVAANIQNYINQATPNTP